MPKSLKQEIVSGVFWSSAERIGSLGIQFLITIIIARVLSPADYGLIGMLSIFTALGAVILDSGFGQALIRKNDVNTNDYSTVFFTNIAFGIIIYVILYFCAPSIALFFQTPELVKISRWVFLIFPINSIGLIHNTIITKNTDFKLLTKVSLISVILSGIFGVVLAYKGLGVWTLVYQTLFYNLTRSILLWFFNTWRPIFVFSFNSLTKLFGFSSNLLGTGVIIVLFNNIYTLLIGKFYSVEQVGFYNQANRFQELPTQTLTAIIQRVSYPILSKIQDDDLRLKAAYRKIINQTIFLNFPLMLGLIAIAHNLFLVLLTEKWLPAVPYFQLLCIYGALFPLHSINVNILKVKGKGKTLLKLEIVRRLIMVAVILVTLKHGILILLAGNIIASAISISINMYYCGREISLKVKDQIKDVAPYFLAALISSITMYLINNLINIQLVFLLFIQLLVGMFIYLALSQILKLNALIEMRHIILEKISKRNI